MEVVLHLGAHRTGSTWVQHLMGARADALAGAGVVVPSTDAVRRAVTPALTGQGAAALVPRALRAARLRRWVARTGRGADRLVISDENLLGPMTQVLSPDGIYPGLRTRLAVLAEALADWPVRLFLGVRGPEWHLPSAWAHLMRTRPVAPFADLKPALLAQPRGWADVLRDLAALFPGARLATWTHEGLAGHIRAVLAAMLGDWPGAVEEWWANASPSARALDEIAASRAAGRRIGREAATAIAETYPKGPYPGFHPWTDDEAQLCRTRHAADMAAVHGLSDDIYGWTPGDPAKEAP